jgi:hypothetical protein
MPTIFLGNIMVITDLKNVNLIKETTEYSRNQVFVFAEYVDIFLSE